MAGRGGVAIAFDVWGQRGWYGVDVAGESFHTKDIERLFRGKVPDGGATLDVVAQLIPEPTNRHDRNAIKVVVGSSHVGYLPKEIAGDYQPVLRQLLTAGYAPQCGAQIRAWPHAGATAWNLRERPPRPRRTAHVGTAQRRARAGTRGASGR